MTERAGSTDSPPDHEGILERALASSAVGLDAIGIDLADVGALATDITRGTARVTVTLPIPSGDHRTNVEREIRTAVGDTDGVDAVECLFEPSAPDTVASVDLIPDVKHVLAVASGKGGVGKSTVAVNLAVVLASAGASVGIVDADVYGPNVPAMLGLSDHSPETTVEDEMVPREAHGVRTMSIGFVVEEDDPVIWRGPIVDEFLKQLFADVRWGTLDYLIVDMPPGTGDAQLSLVQHLPVSGAVVVTTPQQVAVDDARRGLRGFVRYDVPVLGLVENMSGFECPDCGTDHDVFAAGGANRLANEFDVPVLGRIPLDPAVGTLDADGEAPEPPGVSIPGFGRIQLPRLREERERPTSLPPIALRDGGGVVRASMRQVATRTAARVNQLVDEGRTTESQDDPTR